MPIKPDSLYEWRDEQWTLTDLTEWYGISLIYTIRRLRRGWTLRKILIEQPPGPPRTHQNSCERCEAWTQNKRFCKRCLPLVHDLLKQERQAARTLTETQRLAARTCVKCKGKRDRDGRYCEDCLRPLKTLSCEVCKLDYVSARPEQRFCSLKCFSKARAKTARVYSGKTLRQWSEELGSPIATIYGRVREGRRPDEVPPPSKPPSICITCAADHRRRSDYCSNNCRPKKPPKITPCKNCGTAAPRYRRYCSDSCTKKYTEQIKIQSFWETYEPSDTRSFNETPCWIWKGRLDKDGYGLKGLEVKGRKYNRATRIAYELAVKPIPKGLTVDHLCFTRACINPAHLEAVSSQENTKRRRANKGGKPKQ